MKRISVCLASFNGEKYIARQLNSILVQLRNFDEVIISDDLSTDDTAKIISSIKDERIKFINNMGANGPVANFQNALEAATGDYIFLSDQDDIWLPEKVADMVRLLDKYDLVLSDCRVVDEQLKILQPSFFNSRGTRPGLIRNLLKNSYMGCCMAFRREVLTYVLPIPSTVHMHDWWIGLLVELKGKVYFYDKALLLYVRHGDNASPTGEGSYGWPVRIRNRVSLLINLVQRLIR